MPGWGGRWAWGHRLAGPPVRLVGAAHETPQGRGWGSWGFILCVMRARRRGDYSKNQVKTHLSDPRVCPGDVQRREQGHRNAGSCKPTPAGEPSKPQPHSCVRWLIKVTW